MWRARRGTRFQMNGIISCRWQGAQVANQLRLEKPVWIGGWEASTGDFAADGAVAYADDQPDAGINRIRTLPIAELCCGRIAWGIRFRRTGARRSISILERFCCDSRGRGTDLETAAWEFCRGRERLECRLGWGKTFLLGEKAKLRFESTFTNVLNHTNFAPPAVDINNTQTFGALQSNQLRPMPVRGPGSWRCVWIFELRRYSGVSPAVVTPVTSPGRSPNA